MSKWQFVFQGVTLNIVRRFEETEARTHSGKTVGEAYVVTE